MNPHPRTPQPLQPAHRTSLAETVATQLERLILHSLQPDEQLPPERELAQHLQVSRLVVREGLKLLAERGLVTARQGAGTFAKRIDDAAFRKPFRLYVAQHDLRTSDLFMFRVDLEGSIARHAAERATKDDLHRLRANLDEMQEAVRQLRNDPTSPEVHRAYAWCDVTFHQLLAQATNNPLYEAMLMPLVDTLLEVRLHGVRVEIENSARAHSDHEAILEAVERRDGTEAQARMTQHLDQVRSWVERNEPSPRSTIIDNHSSSPPRASRTSRKDPA